MDIPPSDFVAVCLHSGGGFGAREVVIRGTSREEVLAAARANTPIERYLSRIASSDGQTLWAEGSGWKPAADAILPA